MTLNSGCYQSLHLFSSSFFLNFSNPSLMKYKENKTNVKFTASAKNCHKFSKTAEQG